MGFSLGGSRTFPDGAKGPCETPRAVAMAFAVALVATSLAACSHRAPGPCDAGAVGDTDAAVSVTPNTSATAITFGGDADVVTPGVGGVVKDAGKIDLGSRKGGVHIVFTVPSGWQFVHNTAADPLGLSDDSAKTIPTKSTDFTTASFSPDYLKLKICSKNADQNHKIVYYGLKLVNSKGAKINFDPMIVNKSFSSSDAPVH